MNATKAPELVRVNSHHVSEQRTNGPGIDKEEVWLYYRAEWCGQPCVVQMCADRYRASCGLTSWRIVAREVRAGEPGEYGPVLTETARQRLSHVCDVLVDEWLKSNAYRVSEAAAYGNMIARRLREQSRYDTERDVRGMVDAYKDKLATGVATKLLACVDAYGAFVRNLENAEAAIKSAGEQ